jgi:hypothetical protein
LFRISDTAVSRTFLKVLDVMYTRMGLLITWPERHNLRRTMPAAFKEGFGNKVTVIIDCFQVFIETPSKFAGRGPDMVQLYTP